MKLTIFLFLIFSTSAFSREFEFEDFMVKVTQISTIQRIDLRSHPKARRYRTILRKAAREGINFAGHYTIAIWGCGSSCAQIAIIDQIDGKVYFPESVSYVSWGGWWHEKYGYHFKPDSRLLKVFGDPNEAGAYGNYFYEWANNELRLLKFVPRDPSRPPKLD